ncbi:hypothetical protein C8R44DRAFT_892388 [Mycena epipterygia]|nr:hypothetical protein C8R44DRAFT_892388 [Mycena epipterygia]
MSKSSAILSPSDTQLSLPYSAGHLSLLATPPPPYDQGNITQINKVRLGNTTFAYHTEILRSHRLPDVVLYENLDSLEVYTLCLAPLAHRVLVADDNVAKMMCGVDPYFSGVVHHVTHHDPASAHVWISAYIESPDHLLFHAYCIQNCCRLHRGSTLKAPSAWSGVTRVIEKVGESLGWTILELRLLTTNHTIYLRILNEHVVMDRTWYAEVPDGYELLPVSGGEHMMM